MFTLKNANGINCTIYTLTIHHTTENHDYLKMECQFIGLCGLHTCLESCINAIHNDHDGLLPKRYIEKVEVTETYICGTCYKY